MEKKHGQGKLLLCFAAMAALLLLLCSKSSPVFPLNDWMDANAFFTIGKAMMNGIVLYRDVFDQKGPLLFFVYGIAWLLDHDGFLGAFLIEIICFAAFLYYGYKTVCLFADKASPLLMLLPGAAVVSAKTFVQGGSAEELCLPLFAMALYSLLRFACQPPVQRALLPMREVFVQGCLAGCVLWVKFNLMGLFLGWVLWFAAAYLRRGWYKPLAGSCAVYLGGMGLAALPWMVYFTCHGALGNLFADYFGSNIFSYSDLDQASPAGVPALVLRLAQRIWWTLYDSPVPFLLILIGVLHFCVDACRCRRGSALSAVLCTAALLALGILTPGGFLKYYPLPLFVYAPLGLIPLAKWLAAADRRKVIGWLAVPAALVLCVWVSPNREYRFRPKEELPQWQFADMILETGPQTKLLNYGALDGGLYTTTKLLPPCRFYYIMNVNGDLAEEQQHGLLQQGAVDCVVALNPDLDQQFPAYEMAASSTYDSGEGIRTWYLYRKKEM